MLPIQIHSQKDPPPMKETTKKWLVLEGSEILSKSEMKSEQSPILTFTIHRTRN